MLRFFSAEQSVTLHQPDLVQCNPHLDPNLAVGLTLVSQRERFLVVGQMSRLCLGHGHCVSPC